MNVMLQQLQVAIQTESEIPDTAWYVTIDASQVKRELGINWEELSQQHQWSNLLKGTSEGQEVDLTCWLAPLTTETLQLTIDLTQKSPFCCTWLQSTWPINDIATYWQRSANPQLPGANKGLLRFYDACVLDPLQAVLTPQQWQTLAAPLIQWLTIERFGNLHSIPAPIQEVSSNGQFSLSKLQIKKLNDAGQTDNVIFHMLANEHLPQSYDPFTIYQQISTALALLNKHKIVKPQDRYLFSVLTLDWPLAHFASPELEEALSRLKPEEINLSQIVEQHAPEKNNAIA